MYACIYFIIVDVKGEGLVKFTKENLGVSFTRNLSIYKKSEQCKILENIFINKNIL